MRIPPIAATLFTVALISVAQAQTAQINVADAKSRPTAPGAEVGVVYLTVMNHGDADDTLTGLSTPIADKAEAHRTTTENGITRMDAAPDLVVKAGGMIQFKPGGLHVMLTGLKQPLKAGDSFKLTLTFAKAGAVETSVAVEGKAKPASPMSDMPGMKM